MPKLKEKISEIEEIKMIKDNEDGTKQYSVTSAENVDLRKKLFEVLPKEEITIFELKKDESTLEDAFIKLIDSTKQEPEEIKEEKKQKKLEKKEQKKKEKNKKGGKE